jgi:hypothetical protein
MLDFWDYKEPQGRSSTFVPHRQRSVSYQHHLAFTASAFGSSFFGPFLSILDSYQGRFNTLTISDNVAGADQETEEEKILSDLIANHDVGMPAYEQRAHTLRVSP